MVRILERLDRLAAGLLVAGSLLVASSADAAGDPAQGKMVFSHMCSACHSAAKGGAPIMGPTLFGVVGRRAGSMAGFDYSAAMKSAGFTWTDAQLAAYLPAPAKLVPGTKMTFLGVKNPGQLDNLIAYLDTLK